MKFVFRSLAYCWQSAYPIRYLLLELGIIIYTHEMYILSQKICEFGLSTAVASS